jgi:hypothetical protein
MHFDLLDRGDLGIVNKEVLNEKAVLISAILTLQKIAIPILRHTCENLSPLISYPDMLSIEF